MLKQATLIITPYLTYLSFLINYSFLYNLKVLEKPELSMHGSMGHQNTLLVS